MKGFVAAALTIAPLLKAKKLQRPLHFAFTYDEEIGCLGGKQLVLDLQKRNLQPAVAIVGEPTSAERFGDVIRNGRRGSLGACLRVKGIQGHVAYPHLADNPVHRAAPALAELVSIIWDNGDAHFPPTTLQISNIHAGTGATNVIPAAAEIEFNLRYSPATTIEHIQSTVEQLCDRHKLDYDIEWKDSARPFITQPGTLTDALQQSIQEHTGHNATLDTGGGTSDGRFIAPTGAQVIEFGPINKTIHQIDERILCEDIDTLSSIYESVMAQLLNNED